jgi:assimilatory nitrate reductase catalytic subunit
MSVIPAPAGIQTGCTEPPPERGLQDDFHLPMKPISTTCPYCGVGCGVLVSPAGAGFTVRGDPDHPANRGRLCSKGAALADTLGLDDRLLHPQIDGRQVDWDTALDRVAAGFRRVIAEHGPDAVAFYVSGQLLTEDYYAANKLMKGCIGSGNIDTNSRLCMSSAVAAHKRAFGSDTVPGCYEDLELADLIILVGSNAAWTHPVVYQRIVAAKKARPGMQIVVIDPRRTATADIADLFLPLAPGADAWLWNGLLHHLKREDAVDWAWLEAHVEGFGAAFAAVSGLTLPEVARQCGLTEAEVAAFFRLFTTTPRTVTLFSQGINQSSSGVDKGNALINCHLATGRVGKPGASPFSLTGQPNAMGGREVGGLANQLAAHMDFAPADVDRVARFWGLPQTAPRPGLKAVDLFQAVGEGRIKALWIMATNPVVSMPDADAVAAALQGCEFVVLSDVTASTDTARLAHVLLPAAAWGEKDGTVTNSERRISRQRAFMPLPGEARPDWWIIGEVARRLGFGAQFPYQEPAELFAEHAALSGFENDGSRDFDLSAILTSLPSPHGGDCAPSLPSPHGGGAGGEGATPPQAKHPRHPPPIPAGAAIGPDFADTYATLHPIQWPLTQTGGTPRLFADGRFFTPGGKARMVPVTPRPPSQAPTAGQPFVFNTGRVRDQWHTMTRTAKAPRLLAHIDEPFLSLHPDDARRIGLTEGGLARVRQGQPANLQDAPPEYRARVRLDGGQRPGSVFTPIHWNGRFSARARVGTLIPASVDPISGQPEFKHAPVVVEALPAAWHGFLITREGFTLTAFAAQPAYWNQIPGQHCHRMELAHDQPPAPWLDQARQALGLSQDWMALQDPGAGRYRGALMDGDRLLAVYFIEPTAAGLPPRHWLESLFAKPVLSVEERTALLLGRPSRAMPESGPVVCACFGVGRADIQAAIVAGADSVEALGIRLKAGSNCGSCIPELRQLLVQAAPAIVAPPATP